MVFRPEFRQAISVLAQAIQSMTERGFEPPVLVGGAAVEFYTASAVTSGDFDFVTPHQRALEAALAPHGFERDNRAGALTVGLQLIHRELGCSVQVVSGQLMDGKADRDKIFVVDVDGSALSVIPVEDLIADRMGQAYAGEPPRGDMLDQASKLLALAAQVDDAYLDKRIREETLDGADLSALRRFSSV